MKRNELINQVRQLLHKPEGEHPVFVNGLYYRITDIDFTNQFQPVPGAKGISKHPKGNEFYKISGVEIYF